MLMNVRLSDEDYEDIQKAATKLGETMPEFIGKVAASSARLTLDVVKREDVDEEEFAPEIVTLEIHDPDAMRHNMGYVTGYLVTILNSFLNTPRLLEHHVVDIPDLEDGDIVAAVSFGPKGD